MIYYPWAIWALYLCHHDGIDAFALSAPGRRLALLSSRAAWTTTTTTTAVSSRLFAEAATASFIDRELRDAAMRLHTKEQAPKEGKAPSKQMNPYVPTHMDYLKFLVDSQHVYQALEDIVNERDELAVFRNMGLERTIPLEKDIEFMVKEFGLKRPPVGKAGVDYANSLRRMNSVPEFVCHLYNIYFAHTAGGRMIGKQMSKLLLDGRTLEFYKWEGDLNEIKIRVKNSIETMAAAWTEEQRRECVDATAATFVGGGAINSYLMGGQNPH